MEKASHAAIFNDSHHHHVTIQERSDAITFPVGNSAPFMVPGETNSCVMFRSSPTAVFVIICGSSVYKKVNLSIVFFSDLQCIFCVYMYQILHFCKQLINY